MTAANLMPALVWRRSARPWPRFKGLQRNRHFVLLGFVLSRLHRLRDKMTRQNAIACSITALRTRGVSVFDTADLIREMFRAFIPEHGVSANASFNAQIGRTLSRKRDELGLRFLGTHKVRGDDGTLSTTARWAFAE